MERLNRSLFVLALLLAAIWGGEQLWALGNALKAHLPLAAEKISPQAPAVMQESRPAPATRPAVRVTKMKVTAYCPGSCCCGEYADGRTATNDDAYVCDGVAADFKLLPKRTLLEIPGAGIKEVDDTGGVMRKAGRQNPPVYHIDLRFPTHRGALKWGVQWLDVKVLSPPKPRSPSIDLLRRTGQRRIETERR